jgi:hypothetical protein
VQDTSQTCRFLHVGQSAEPIHPANIAKSMSYASLQPGSQVICVTLNAVGLGDARGYLRHTDTQDAYDENWRDNVS